MKKLLFILPAFLFTIALNAQTQTEDEVYIGKGKTFGNYNGRGIIIPDVGKNTKPVEGQTTITGKVVSVSPVTNPTDQRGELYSFNLQKADGTIITVGTKDHDFSVPKQLVGKTVTIEGQDLSVIPSGRGKISKNNQKDIQFAAKGIKVVD